MGRHKDQLRNEVSLALPRQNDLNEWTSWAAHGPGWSQLRFARAVILKWTKSLNPNSNWMICPGLETWTPAPRVKWGGHGSSCSNLNKTSYPMLQQFCFSTHLWYNQDTLKTFIHYYLEDTRWVVVIDLELHLRCFKLTYITIALFLGPEVIQRSTDR